MTTLFPASHLRVVYTRECFSSISLSPEERDYHDSQDLDVSKDALVNIASLCFGAIGPILSASARHYKGNALSRSVLKIMLSRRLGAAQSIEPNTASVKKVLAAIK